MHKTQKHEEKDKLKGSEKRHFSSLSTKLFEPKKSTKQTKNYPMTIPQTKNQRTPNQPPINSNWNWITFTKKHIRPILQKTRAFTRTEEKQSPWTAAT